MCPRLYDASKLELFEVKSALLVAASCRRSCRNQESRLVLHSKLGELQPQTHSVGRQFNTGDSVVPGSIYAFLAGGEHKQVVSLTQGLRQSEHQQKADQKTVVQRKTRGTTTVRAI